MKQAEQAAQVKRQKETAAPKPAPRPAVTLNRVMASPATVGRPRSTVMGRADQRTVRAIGGSGAIQTVRGPLSYGDPGYIGYTPSSSGQSGDYFEWARGGGGEGGYEGNYSGPPASLTR